MSKEGEKRNYFKELLWDVAGYAVSAVVIVVIIGVIFLTAYWIHQYYENIRNEMLADSGTREVKSCILTSESSSYIKGSFVLGCGGVYGGSYDDIKYFFYMEGEKGFSLQYLDADKVEIIPITEGIPYIEGHFDKNGDIYHNVGYDEDFNKKITKYFLYLPAEYIVEEYSVNVSELQ